jgi:hypothetical protein
VTNAGLTGTALILTLVNVWRSGTLPVRASRSWRDVADSRGERVPGRYKTAPGEPSAG